MTPADHPDRYARWQAKGRIDWTATRGSLIDDRGVKHPHGLRTAVFGLFMFFMLIVFAVVIGVAPARHAQTLSGVLLIALAGLGAWGLLWVIGGVVFLGSFQRTERRWLLETRCLVDGHPLSGLPTQPDGCTVCPECGAAWALLESRRDRTPAG